jgi:hypothetical protein
MLGREWLDLAREMLPGASEIHWRGAAGRAYYALMLEGREALGRWGFSPAPRDNVHTFLRLRFSFPADKDLKRIGNVLDPLGRLRNQADYDLSSAPPFTTAVRAHQAVQDATVAINLLDAIDGDPARRAAAIAAIRAAFP